MADMDLIMSPKESAGGSQTPPERQLVFLMLPHVHVLDLAGPLQVFFEANGFGARYAIHHCGVEPTVRTQQGLQLSDLGPLPEVGRGDVVIVPGIESTTLDHLDHVPVDWLLRACAAGARLCSVCTGAFVLAHAGLLEGRECTTHWKVADRLAERYPGARVIRNRLFVEDGRVITSAGVASGIDMALSMVEDEHGPIMAARVAREIVIYLRRNGKRDQKSVFLDYRTHLDPGVHQVQDWLAAHPEQRSTIEELAELAGMSSRNLTRRFRQLTGITLKEFSQKLKLEVAENLLYNPRLTVEAVASQCGFEDARQLRRLWQRHHRSSPSAWRAQGLAQ